MLSIVFLYLAVFTSPPVAVAAPVMMSTEGPAKNSNFLLWPRRSLPPDAFSVPTVMATDRSNDNQNFQPSSSHRCHCGHSAEVTKFIPAVLNTRAGHYHYRSSVVTKPDEASSYIRNQQYFSTSVTEFTPAVLNTRAGHYHYRSSVVTEPDQASAYIRDQHDHLNAVTDAKSDPYQNHHNLLQQTSISTPLSSVENTVTEDISAYAR